MIDGIVGAATPPPPHSSHKTPQLRRALDAAGFTAGGVRDALGAHGDVLSDGRAGVAHDRRLESAEPALASLIRLLVLGRDVDAETVEPQLLEALVEHGVAVDENGTARSLIRLVPHDHLLVASDRLGTTGADHVAAVHRPSAALANLTVRRRVPRAADVGTGNGVQALLCASHCERVVATDVNERALAFAEFNAAVNGIDNVEFRAGSFFEPLEGERFDLVVSNPPYVISPETSLIFRDSGLPGDAVSAQLVQTLPELLEDDAFATIMISWAADEDEAARPRGWAEGRGCDGWLLRTAADDPLSAALSWNRAPEVDPDSVEEKVEAWLAYFERLGIERIAYGTLVLHRRAGENWFRSNLLPPQRIAPASAQLERMFAADVDGVLDRPLSLVPTALVERSARLEDGTWRFVASTVGLQEGVPFGVNLDRIGAALVERFDGREPLRTQLPQLASSLGVSSEKLEVFAETLARHLVEHGVAV
jgi:SAM-dependent methyltransferase